MNLVALFLFLLSIPLSGGDKVLDHWAFSAPRKARLPKIEDTSWPSSAIDYFVLNRLERENLKPSARAVELTLLRRTALDLTGLPPSPALMAQYKGDRSPRRFERFVDRLLDSVQYGEHMARLWLDLARYADTNGYQYDLERNQWVWRDWVIAAFNDNMPFDQFTIKQLAGDLLPDSTPQDRLATAFHRNHPITIEGGVIDEEYRTEYVVDRVVTTSTVWLGLTMMCCRCHDHKYDPISQREFFQFFDFFNQVPERGLNGFAPREKITSPLQNAERIRVETELVSIRERIKQRFGKHKNEYQHWDADLSKRVQSQWIVTDPFQSVSKGGATLTRQPDRSILATGMNPAKDTYEFTFRVDSPIVAIQLEALTHKSFVGGGTGRGSNGNFVLSEFQIEVSSRDQPESFKLRSIASASADYSQKNYEIGHAIDGRIDASGWAVDGNVKRENRIAQFSLKEAVNPQNDAFVRVRMHNRYGASHQIGRMRFSFAVNQLSHVPQQVRGLLLIDRPRRSVEQSEELRDHFVHLGKDQELQSLVEVKDRLKERLGQLASMPETMVMRQLSKPRGTYVLERGEYDKRRELVTASVPSSLPAMDPNSPRNRLGLAQWLVQPGHPLTSRVAVNRLWQQLFGVGLVKTAEDFGTQGESPSHPKLLDWLAVDFVESGWDIKRLLKMIVMSSSYQQSSTATEGSRQNDPANRLLTRGPSSRLDAEVIRDSALAVSGLLVDHVGGPSVFPYHPKGLWQEINNRPGYSRTYRQDSGSGLYRRSLYTFWKRTVPPPSMATFDAPGREYCVVRRSVTNTPLQALVLLHDPQFIEAAQHLALRVLSRHVPLDEQLRAAFESVCIRSPHNDELAILLDQYELWESQFSADPKSASRLLSVGDKAAAETTKQSSLAAMTTVCRILFNLSEFVTKP